MTDLQTYICALLSQSSRGYLETRASALKKESTAPIARLYASMNQEKCVCILHHALCSSTITIDWPV